MNSANWRANGEGIHLSLMEHLAKFLSSSQLLCRALAGPLKDTLKGKLQMKPELPQNQLPGPANPARVPYDPDKRPWRITQQTKERIPRLHEERKGGSGDPGDIRRSDIVRSCLQGTARLNLRVHHIPNCNSALLPRVRSLTITLNAQAQRSIITLQHAC